MVEQGHKSCIGLVAGWGDFPFKVAQTLKQNGHRVVGVGIKDHVDARLAELCDDFRVFGLGRMGAQIRYLKRAGVTQATMAGKIFKVRIFQPFHLLRHLPDWVTLKHFYPFLISRTRDCRDDTLLGAVTDLYAHEGIEFVPATDYAPQLLVQPGCLTHQKPSSAQMKDIEFGWKIAREMGRLDIGQSVAVKNQTVMAVEAIEGTDECIRRAGQLCPSGFTVVKVAKPAQDMRFDVPTVGLRTIETMRQAGGKILAIEARRTIILDEAQTIEQANRYGIGIVSMEESVFPIDRCDAVGNQSPGLSAVATS